MIPGDISSIYSEWESDRLKGPKSRGEGAAGQAAPRGWRSREQGSGSWEGSAGGGVVAERGRGERSDRGRSDKRENDESGKTARWHEGCSENRRGTAKGDRKRQTTKGGRRLASHILLLNLPGVVAVLKRKNRRRDGVPSSHPSLDFLFFSLFFRFFINPQRPARVAA